MTQEEKEYMESFLNDDGIDSQLFEGMKSYFKTVYNKPGKKKVCKCSSCKVVDYFIEDDGLPSGWSRIEGEDLPVCYDCLHQRQVLVTQEEADEIDEKLGLKYMWEKYPCNSLVPARGILTYDDYRKQQVMRNKALEQFLQESDSETYEVYKELFKGVNDYEYEFESNV